MLFVPALPTAATPMRQTVKRGCSSSPLGSPDTEPAETEEAVRPASGDTEDREIDLVITTGQSKEF